MAEAAVARGARDRGGIRVQLRESRLESFVGGIAPWSMRRKQGRVQKIRGDAKTLFTIMSYD